MDLMISIKSSIWIVFKEKKDLHHEKVVVVVMIFIYLFRTSFGNPIRKSQ